MATLCEVEVWGGSPTEPPTPAPTSARSGCKTFPQGSSSHTFLGGSTKIQIQSDVKGVGAESPTTFHRVNWLMHERCTSLDDPTKCSECTSQGEDGCWFGKEHSSRAEGRVLPVHFSSGSIYKKSKLIANLDCEGADHVIIGTADLRPACNSNEIQIYRDGELQHFGPACQHPFGTEPGRRNCLWVERWHQHDRSRDFTHCKVGLPDSSKGVTIEVVFTPSNVHRSAYIHRIWMNTNADYKNCEDNKACLKIFDNQHDKDQMEIRNSPHAQYRCLAGILHGSTACNRWKQCLSQSKLDECAIMTYLLSIGADHTSLAEENLHRRRRRRRHGTECNDPFLSDPESWDCECHQTLVQKCGQTDVAAKAECYRSHLCTLRSVCDEWKNAVGCVAQQQTALLEAGRNATDSATLSHGLTSLLSDASQISVGWNCG